MSTKLMKMFVVKGVKRLLVTCKKT